jgi:hypothetical protein
VTLDHAERGAVPAQRHPLAPRSRWCYAGAVVATIALGLASRAWARHLPWWLAKNAGDALYATMMVFAIGWLAPRARTWRIAAAAVAVCFAVELSQLYQAPWIDAVRATLPGRLVLGQGFHGFDLISYLIGAAVGVAVDLGALHRARGRSS